MRTYLKNLLVLKSTIDLRMFHVYTDWELTSRKVELASIFNDIANSKLVITFKISAGTTTGIVNLQQDVFIHCSWMALPASHQIQIIGIEGNNITDDETVQTDRLLN